MDVGFINQDWADVLYACSRFITAEQNPQEVDNIIETIYEYAVKELKESGDLSDVDADHFLRMAWIGLTQLCHDPVALRRAQRSARPELASVSDIRSWLVEAFWNLPSKPPSTSRYSGTLSMFSVQNLAKRTGGSRLLEQAAEQRMTSYRPLEQATEQHLASWRNPIAVSPTPPDVFTLINNNDEWRTLVFQCSMYVRHFDNLFSLIVSSGVDQPWDRVAGELLFLLKVDIYRDTYQSVHRHAAPKITQRPGAVLIEALSVVMKKLSPDFEISPFYDP